MKSLQDFKTLVEEEKSDYSKFDMLVRAGLANKAQIQRIHKILDKMQEEKPVFNNADRMILQNLFNKMVDLISNNKQILSQAKRAVREDVEVEEGVLDTSDFKVGPSGKKVKAHRFTVGDTVKEDIEIEEATMDIPDDPPYVLILKRKAVRMYPNKTKVALYYNDRLSKFFTIPYGMKVELPIQGESVEVQESVMDGLHKIVAGKQAQSVKFANGQSRKVDHYTASAITQVHKAVNDDNKKKLSDMVHKSPAHFEKVAAFAFSKAK
jgi:hypothetical protein